jgi:CheY-like chemotaxis protein
MLAHELRNPLAPVLNAVQLLRLRGPSDPLLAQQRDVIGRQITQMKRLLDDLLDVARITRGSIQISKHAVDLRVILRTAVEAARPLLNTKGHDLQVSLPNDPLVVDGDTTRLIQVFSNLLNNAAKYTDSGGRIWLTAEREPGAGSSPGEAVARVKDTGEGMTPEMLHRAFDLFSQSGQGSDRPQGGLGIGLTLVRRLVALHGGTASATSDGPDKGSEFTVRLPLLQTETLAPADHDERAPAPATRRRRILVVDDNVDSADSMAQLLGFWNHEVLTAHDGLEALRMAQTFRPEIAVLDIGLPRMNGYQVAREIRALPGLTNVYLIALTGYGQAEDRRQSEEAGFAKHLMKPVDPHEIQAVLAEVP